MTSHGEFTVADFKGIQVKNNWTAFDVLVAVCVQVKKKKSVNNAQKLPLIGVNKLSGKKRSIRESEKNKSINNVKESQSDEQERPIKKLRGFFRSQDTETDEIIKTNKRKFVPVSRPEPVPQENKKKLSKAQKEELARILSQKYDLPDEFREKIKEMNQTGDAKLVIQKMLYPADIKQNQNRFSMPLNQLFCTDFLTEEEKRLVEVRTKDNHLKTIDVTVIEPGLKVREAKFTKWDFNKTSGKGSKSYVLIGAWSDIRKRNELDSGMIMQMWSYRDVKDKLCFALVKLPRRLEFN